MQVLELPGKFLVNSMHAQQDIPSQHRLLNAGMMFGGWWLMDEIRHIAFGVKMKAEGEYIEVKKEDVPAPLQFLHKVIEWDPHSESSENQWKKLVYQMMPGVGAGVGAAAGSMYAFERNGRAQEFKKLKGLEKLNMLDADFVAQYSHSTPLRALAGFFGTFSAASGLTFMYGMFLNPSFAEANGAKVFAGSLSKGNLAPHRAIDAQLGMVGSYVKQAMNSKGEISEAWSKQFVERVLEPLFERELKSPEGRNEARKAIQKIVSDSYHRFQTTGTSADAVAKAVTDDLTKTLGKTGLDKTVKEVLHLDPLKATPGNANPIFRRFNDCLSYLGLSRSVKVGKQPKIAPSNIGLGLAAGGATAAVLGTVTATASGKEPSQHQAVEPGDTPAAGNAATTATDTPQEEAPAPVVAHGRHLAPDATGKTPQEYTYEAMKMHWQEAGKGQPPALLKWMGDAQLAVLPQNRIFCAIGLTAGLMFAGNMAKIATGYGLDGKALEKAKVPTYLQNMIGIVKDYNPKGLRPRDRWIKYGQAAVYSLGGLIGIKLGTDYAYRTVAPKNSDPHYLEDYLPRISMHQGNSWSWLAAASGILGSASGMFTMPIPGLNYGVGLAARSTSMQDRNFMISGMNEWMSGASTTSFLRLREGTNYLCHYAVNNPAETPAQIEFLAYTLLAPLFKEQLTVEHIQQFTQAVHDVRDQYWQAGGIPKEKRKEALKTMREVFTGPGLEVLLINMGLNPGSIKFDTLNGLTGSFGNALGAASKVAAEQEAYDKALVEHLDTYVKQNLVTQERADWVKQGIEARKQKLKSEDLAAATDTPAMQAQAAPSPETPQEAQEKSSFSAKHPKKSPVSELIDKADNPGDWRDAAQLRREHRAPAAIGG